MASNSVPDNSRSYQYCCQADRGLAGGANTWGFIRGTPGLESTKANLMKRKKEGQKKVKSHWVFMLINGEFTDEQLMTSHWQVWRPLQMFVRGNVI
ncbi:Uncharacterized protein HZ326_3350 [Fusarium oxysporum f. sp. albedinis]|nr:Uncharacterized protein HZ326_3350 [Fusarium oxysporum f. sp. albedinis]KAK2483924.1 hypothetical protein H9L39_05716 [Fusarium oxysporum f. sp. albedinis]